MKIRQSIDIDTKMIEMLELSDSDLSSHDIKCFNKQLWIHLNQIIKKKNLANNSVNKEFDDINKKQTGNFRT